MLRPESLRSPTSTWIGAVAGGFEFREDSGRSEEEGCLEPLVGRAPCSAPNLCGALLPRGSVRWQAGLSSARIRDGARRNSVWSRWSAGLHAPPRIFAEPYFHVDWCGGQRGLSSAR